MRHKLSLTTALTLTLGLTAGSAQASFVLVEDWESYTIDQEPHVSATWTRNTNNDSHGRIAADPAGGSDQVLNITSGNSGRGYYTNLGANALQDGFTSTLFFRFYADGATVLVRLTDYDAPTNAWYHEDRGGAGIDDELTFSGAGLDEDSWYNAWIVVDHTADTYDVYYSKGLEAATLVANDTALQLTTDSQTLDNTPDDLDVLLFVLGQPQNNGNSTYIGDIWVDNTSDVANLTNPIPEPAALALMGLGGLLMLNRRKA